MLLGQRLEVLVGFSLALRSTTSRVDRIPFCIALGFHRLGPDISAGPLTTIDVAGSLLATTAQIACIFDSFAAFRALITGTGHGWWRVCDFQLAHLPCDELENLWVPGKNSRTGNISLIKSVGPRVTSTPDIISQPEFLKTWCCFTILLVIGP